MPAAAAINRVILCCVLAAAAGCGEGSVSRNWSGRPLSLAEFAEAPAGEDALPGAPSDPGDAMHNMAGDGDDSETTTFEFEFMEREVLWTARPGERVVVDSLVGEVNGKPIFADEFFQPIEDRLMRAATEFRGPQRDAAFRRIVNSWLKDIVLNSLLLAEAESSLSTQEQVGLLSFLRSIQEEEIRLGGGTRSGAEERRRGSGDDLDQYLGRQKDLVLLSQMASQKINPRVIVSWRDIEREYQRRYDEFNPQATVTLARIRLRTAAQADEIEQVKLRLADGEAFSAIAEELGYKDGGVWQTFVVPKGGISEINVNDEMKKALDGLKDGDTSPPFTLGLVTVWLHVASLDQPPTYSIYDPKVQRILKNAIRMRRTNDEWNKYIESLLETGIYDELDKMSERLYQIAIMRYAQ